MYCGYNATPCPHDGDQNESHECRRDPQQTRHVSTVTSSSPEGLAPFEIGDLLACPFERTGHPGLVELLLDDLSLLGRTNPPTMMEHQLSTDPSANHCRKRGETQEGPPAARYHGRRDEGEETGCVDKPMQGWRAFAPDARSASSANQSIP